MRAMILNSPGEPLRLTDVPAPKPEAGQVLVRVLACGVCRTDLHVVDGELRDPKLPLIPGHQIVGEVVETGEHVEWFAPGYRVGVPWLGWTCGRCRYCLSGRENLCDDARFTGYQIDGGYAEYAVADYRFCFPVSDAPAHIVIQVARHQGRRVFAFTRDGDTKAQSFAREMGALWAGDSSQPPPEELDAAIIFAPVGTLVPTALRAVAKGGMVVCGGIHMSDIPSFPYEILWGERTVCSVANLTRRDGEEFLALAPEIPVRTRVASFPLAQANEALDSWREGRLSGAAVIVIDESAI